MQSQLDRTYIRASDGNKKYFKEKRYDPTWDHEKLKNHKFKQK